MCTKVETADGRDRPVRPNELKKAVEDYRREHGPGWPEKRQYE